MNRINKKFKDLKNKGKKAFVAFITAGYPDIATTKKIALEMERCGVDIIELGVPFSDPLADGPTIQMASSEALKHRVSLASTLRLVKGLRNRINIPIVLLSYYNPILQYGESRFARESVRAGVDGVIIPDLPPEEGKTLSQYARKSGLATIFLLAPTSTRERIRKVSQKAKGFIYYVSLTGVTGTRESLPQSIKQDVKQIKKLTRKPVCVGFGISRKEQARDIARVADGVIMGSAIIKVIKGNLGRMDLTDKVGQFLREMRKAI